MNHVAEMMHIILQTWEFHKTDMPEDIEELVKKLDMFGVSLKEYSEMLETRYGKIEIYSFGIITILLAVTIVWEEGQLLIRESPTPLSALKNKCYGL
jgi:hypothetical protein